MSTLLRESLQEEGLHVLLKKETERREKKGEVK